MAKGLDEIHLFSDTVGVDVVLKGFFGQIWMQLGPRMLCEFGASYLSSSCLISSSKLCLAEAYPGIPMARKTRPLDYLGTAMKVTVFLSIQFIVLIFSQDSR